MGCIKKQLAPQLSKGLLGRQEFEGGPVESVQMADYGGTRWARNADEDRSHRFLITAATGSRNARYPNGVIGA